MAVREVRETWAALAFIGRFAVFIAARLAKGHIRHLPRPEAAAMHPHRQF